MFIKTQAKRANSKLFYFFMQMYRATARVFCSLRCVMVSGISYTKALPPAAQTHRERSRHRRC